MIKTKKLLVVGGKPTINWYDIFRDTKVNGYNIEVEFSMWDEMFVTSYSDNGCVCDLLPSKYAIPGTPMTGKRTFCPDFLLIRGACRGAVNQDWHNSLLAFMFCGMSAVNSLESLYNCLEKPVIYSKLLALHKKYGDAFPLIKQTFYAQ